MKIMFIAIIGFFIGTQAFAKTLPTGHHVSDDFSGGHCSYDYDGTKIQLKYWGPGDPTQICSKQLAEPLPQSDDSITVDAGKCSAEFDFDKNGVMSATYSIVDGSDFYNVNCVRWK